MAKAQTRKTEKIQLKLELDRKEARFLLNLVQNPANDRHPDDEPQHEADLRSAIFESLKEQL